MKTISASIVVMTTLLSGCASVANIGENEFSCPGVPSGVVCANPVQVYGMTNSRNAIVTMNANGKKSVLADDDKNAQAQTPAKKIQLPTPLSQPMPVMEQAQVMRIWIAPWISKVGDLHYPSYIYTEITPRRWATGNLVKGQSATIPSAAFIEADRDTDAGKGGTLPMAQGTIDPVKGTKKTGAASQKSIGIAGQGAAVLSGQNPSKN